MPLTHYRQYILQLQVGPRWRNCLPGHLILFELFTLQATGGVICSYNLRNAPVLQLPFKIRLRPCVTVTKCPCTSTHLMSLYYTERQPNHNLMYTVDHTFGYRSKKFMCTCTKSSAHAHGTELEAEKEFCL